MTTLELFAQRLREERNRKGLNQEDFAALGDVKKNSQVQYEAAKTPPTVEYLLKLADHGVDAAYVLTGQGERGLADAIAVAQGAIRPTRRTAGDDPRDLVAVHEIDLAYGLGGTFSDGPVETQTLHFSRSWVRAITSAPPSMLTFARGRGDSMQPTIQDGDIVLIDRSINTIREQDAIWALTIGDFAMIKRVRVRGPMVSILSDNELVPPDEAHFEEINVVGRVVFVGRKL